ncbi:MAG: hypothetical protein Q8T08_24830 [Ignavibacteria bacterium]|nr:hypothetical protein [Ignavibacteria bacterium]
MSEKRAKVEINWDENLEQKVEKKFNEWSKTCGNKTTVSGAGASGLYCVGFIGAAVYFIQSATSFWMGVVGFLKALVWPGFLVYELFKFLQI